MSTGTLYASDGPTLADLAAWTTDDGSYGVVCLDDGDPDAGDPHYQLCLASDDGWHPVIDYSDEDDDALIDLCDALVAALRENAALRAENTRLRVQKEDW